MTSHGVIKILLADDHAMVRMGLRLVLDRQPDLKVVAEAGDGAEALELALAHDLDLAILDLSMPSLTGLQVARRLSEQRPKIRTLILSMHDSEQIFLQALRSGSSGYVRKADADSELVKACRALIRGEPFFYPSAINTLVRQYLEQVRRGETDTADPLSDREREVVKLIAEGRSGKEIAKILTISEHTVERHRGNICAKLGMRDRVHLTRYAIRQGLVQP
ncbi:MAG: response regulator [Egibacteraceae bacterium]